MREAALPRRAREARLDRLEDPRRTVGDHQQGIAEAVVAHVLEERADRLRILLRARHQVQQDLAPARGEAPRRQHRLALAARADPLRHPVDELAPSTFRLRFRATGRLNDRGRYR